MVPTPCVLATISQLQNDNPPIYMQLPACGQPAWTKLVFQGLPDLEAALAYPHNPLWFQVSAIKFGLTREKVALHCLFIRCLCSTRASAGRGHG